MGMKAGRYIIGWGGEKKGVRPVKGLALIWMNYWTQRGGAEGQKGFPFIPMNY